ncbi:nucleotidyltransferase domain-containing protein [Streptomyces parvus]|uniref:nucleotidyltransferase domain-containing protein n=1 Tax=Streptomyces parvus TaxID=66428 RepID=UPI00369C320A
MSPRGIEALDSRWASAWTPDEAARRLAGVRAPWCVAAGWALDLFRGGQTRAHGDIEIAVPAGRFPEVRRSFPGYVFDAAGSGRIWEDAAPAPYLSPEQRTSLARLLDRVYPGHPWPAGL